MATCPDAERAIRADRRIGSIHNVFGAKRALKFGLRMLAKNRGFTAVAVLSLALGIGTNTTMFGIVDAALLRPLPVEDPDQLASVFTGSEKGAGGSVLVSGLPRHSGESTLFAGVLAHGGRGAFVSTSGRGEMVAIDVVSSNFFSVLRVTPALGRPFLPAANLSAEDSGVVVSYAKGVRLRTSPFPASNLARAGTPSINQATSTVRTASRSPLAVQRSDFLLAKVLGAFGASSTTTASSTKTLQLSLVLVTFVLTQRMVTIDSHSCKRSATNP